MSETEKVEEELNNLDNGMFKKSSLSHLLNYEIEGASGGFGDYFDVIYEFDWNYNFKAKVFKGLNGIYILELFEDGNTQYSKWENLNTVSEHVQYGIEDNVETLLNEALENGRRTKVVQADDGSEKEVEVQQYEPTDAKITGNLNVDYPPLVEEHLL